MSRSVSVCFNRPSLRCTTSPFVCRHFLLTFRVPPWSSHTGSCLPLGARCSLPLSCLLSPLEPEWTSSLYSFPFSSPPQEGERFSANIPPVLQLCLQPDTRQPGIHEGAAWFTEVSHCHLMSLSRFCAHCETCVNSVHSILASFWRFQWTERKTSFSHPSAACLTCPASLRACGKTQSCGTWYFVTSHEWLLSQVGDQTSSQVFFNPFAACGSSRSISCSRRL